MELEENEIPESKVNIVPCIKWVKRGVAKSNPEKVQLTKEELVNIINDTRTKLQITENEGESSTQAQPAANTEDEFNLDKYDEDDETTGLQQLGIQSIAELPTAAEDNFDDDDDSDKEDDIIKPSDNLLLVGKVDGDASILEVYIYNESEGSLYCHHDLLLPAFPLCIEWLDFEPGQSPGNYCAIGSMSPVIEIWDLDIVNCLEAAYSLGTLGSKKKKTNPVGHKDAVLDLAWNKNYHHVMASASADHTVLLWDIEHGKTSVEIDKFGEKVQCVDWHRLEGYTLLAGGFDQKAKVFDCRDLNQFQTYDLDGEAERLMWSPTEPFMFYAGTSEGSLYCFDCRIGQLWKVKAHEKELTGLSVSPQCPGLLLTTSADETLKIWDTEGSNEPVLVHEKDFKMGAVHCLEHCPDLPFVVAGGGSHKVKNMTVLDISTIEPVKEHFGSRPLVSIEVQENEEMSTND